MILVTNFDEEIVQKIGLSWSREKQQVRLAGADLHRPTLESEEG